MSNISLFFIALFIIIMSLLIGVSGGSIVAGWLDSVLNPIVQNGKM